MLFAGIYRGLNVFSPIDGSTDVLALNNDFCLSKLELDGCVLNSLMQTSIPS